MPVSIDSHFRTRPPALRALFQDLRRRLEQWGPLRIDATKTGINLIPKHHMGSVRVLKDRLQVGFVLGRKVESPRIDRYMAIGPRAHLHSMALRSPEDLDGETMAWLAEAYRRAAGVS